jgi:ABC-type transport system involved in multi-copper enzyme maturation permease subunit
MPNIIQTLRNISIIGRITMLEGARKQVFHVLVLAAVFLIFGSASLAKFDTHVHMKMLTDLCMVLMFTIGAIIAITITVTGIPGEMEQKTVYPVIAKPVRRWEFIAGKYAGAMGTVAIALAIMTVTFIFLQVVYSQRVEPAALYVIPFLFLETAILGAISLWLSTFCSWPLAWFLSIILYILGNAKFPLYASLTSHPQNPFNRMTIGLLYHLLPGLESFNFKDAIVHHLTVPNAYLWQTAAYGICYTLAMLALASWSFSRREL